MQSVQRSDYGLNDQGIVVRFHAKSKRFVRLQNFHIGPGAHPASYSVVIGDKREAEYSFPSSAEFKNSWSYSSTSPCTLIA